MKKNIFYLAFASCLSLLAAPIAVFAADLYVQSVKASILSSPALGSQAVAEARRGEILKELEKLDGWHKVSYKDKTGWVSKLLIGLKPPTGKVSILEETEEKIEKGARKRASAFTTAAAARGLAEQRARISDKFKVDYDGVEKMEKLDIRETEAVDFVSKGVGR